MKGNEERGLSEKLIGKIAKEYAAHQRVLANILRPFAQLKAAPGSIHVAKAKVKELVRRLDVIAVKWSGVSIAQAYREKQKTVAPIAKSTAVFLDGAKAADRSPLSIAKLSRQSAQDFLEVNASIERTVEKFFQAYEAAVSGVGAARMTGEVQAMSANMEAEVSRKVNYYLARGYDEGSISRKIRSYLEELVGGENFIEIGGRFYELKSLAENMARTELHEAYVSATIDECKKWECDLVQFSKHDDPCPICGPLEGMVFSISGEAEDFPALDDTVEVEVELKSGSKTVQVDPRNPHPQCCLPGTMCEPIGKIVAGSRSIYKGPQIEIVLANGARLSVTENHLLLTPRGFASANRLCKGDDVFYCAFNSGMASVDPDNYREPSLIDEIVETLAETEGMNTRSMKVAPEDFHGDGQSIQSNIDVIWSDGFLMKAWGASFLKLTHEDDLRRAEIGGPPLSGKCNLAAVLSRVAFASDCIMGGRRASVPFFTTRPTCCNSVTLADRPEIAADLPKPDMDSLIGNTETLGKVALQSPRVVEIQKIVAVDVSFYHGPVYDLQTESSLYIANGILSSNCEHNLNPVTRNILRAAGEL